MHAKAADTVSFAKRHFRAIVLILDPLSVMCIDRKSVGYKSLQKNKLMEI